MGLDSKKLGLQFFEDGLHHFEAYEFKQAKRKFAAAAQLLPNQPEILDTLGRTLQQLGEWDKALTYHRRVLKIFQQTNNESGIAKARLNIGMCIPDVESSQRPTTSTSRRSPLPRRRSI